MCKTEVIQKEREETKRLKGRLEEAKAQGLPTWGDADDILKVWSTEAAAGIALTAEMLALRKPPADS